MIRLSAEQMETVSQTICACKFIRRDRIPESCLQDLQWIFEENHQISLTLGPENPLTVMETVMVAFLILGYVENEVASVLQVSPGTAKGYIKRIKKKLSVSRKSELLLRTLKEGCVRLNTC